MIFLKTILEREALEKEDADKEEREKQRLQERKAETQQLVREVVALEDMSSKMGERGQKYAILLVILNSEVKCLSHPLPSQDSQDCLEDLIDLQACGA